MKTKTKSILSYIGSMFLAWWAIDLWPNMIKLNHSGENILVALLVAVVNFIVTITSIRLLIKGIRYQTHE